jgi:ABC-type multidrug transport system fused ATPase/permease subunit
VVGPHGQPDGSRGELCRGGSQYLFGGSSWLRQTLQRIQDYLVIDQEPSSVPEKEPPASWPTSGEIVLDKLSAKYSEDGPTVLDNLEVTIKSGEKVGIVGRTGSGKSTLVSARKASGGDLLRVHSVQRDAVY